MVTIVLSKSCKSFSFDEIWNSTQIESPEINDDKFFGDSWCQSTFATAGIGTCHLSVKSFEPKMANLPILMTFCTLHKPSVVNSMVTIVFCDSWRLPILTIVSIGTCYLLGHSFWPKMVNAPALIKFCTLLKIKTWNRKTNLVSKILLLHYKQNW